MTPRIYQHGELSPGSQVSLSAAASHHLVKVLRARTGDAVTLFNGDGHEYTGKLQDSNSRRCSVSVESSKTCDNESPVRITLLQGLSRHDRMDTTLQKVTELGVNRIIPVICQRSRFKTDAERMEKKHAHWQQVIISACEQSGRCVLPQLDQPLDLQAALAEVRHADCKIVLAPGAETPVHEITSLDENVALLIGPESGLEDSELDMSAANDFQPIHLGPRILRTETAGPAALAAIQTLWGDFS